MTNDSTRQQPTPQRYYTIVTQEPGDNSWHPQWGAYELPDVEVELEEMLDATSWAGVTMGIITTLPDQQSIDAHISDLNKGRILPTHMATAESDTYTDI